MKTRQKILLALNASLIIVFLKKKKSVPKSNGDAVDAVYDRKIPPRFFFFKKRILKAQKYNHIFA